MQSCTCSKTVSVRCGNLPIGRILLVSSLALLTSLTWLDAAPLRASPCTLAWNYNQDASAVGYALYYGITGSGVTNRFDAGMTNRATFYNLLAGSNYFFHAVAYNVPGIESPPSVAVHYCPRALSVLKLTKSAGTSLDLQFQAAPGSGCHVEYTPSLAPPRWQTLCSATADGNGNVTACDPLAGSLPTRYYRAVLP
jgi:hypothetical protein